MKKTVKSILAIALMAVMVLSLAGCGKKEDKKDSGDKLVATKDIAEGESAMGEKKEIVEVTFKDGKADKVTMKMEFEDSSKPSQYAGLLSSMAEEGMTVTAEGNFLVMSMDAAAYAAQEGATEELTRASLEKALVEEGYTVQK